ncbi:M23 family metallopeptidase [Streptomyces sp. NRRL S-31]|uniref:LysM peptidoglycan-binding domain-containing M23 family metallopeptidase n=1 Tax=Streptomyces sp. NRRL S-31 TaxID=1463898 RepID=UPI0004C4F5F6|nr:M23 family metallopeptidase [Streptomyces sp. NRRL S-31]
MPGKGKHRRAKTPRLSRSIAVAGTGGAALALPLLGAAESHAATPAAPSASGKTTTPAAPSGSGMTVQIQTAKKAAKTAATARADVRVYKVRSGDCLSKIAAEQHVSGGWQRLYDDNRRAVGADPSLIHPGLALTLGKKAAPAPAHTAASRQTETAPRPAKAAPQHTKAAPRHTRTAVKPAHRPRASQAHRPTGSGTARRVSTGFTLPVTGAPIGTAYRVAGGMWSSGHHTGVDFVVPTGTPLKAVGAGTVVSAGWGGAYGNQVVIKLHDGRYAQYAHLSRLFVSAGQAVTAGRQIGLSGATGNVTGPHLHFEIRTTPNYGSDIDPLGYLRGHGVSVG